MVVKKYKIKFENTHAHARAHTHTHTQYTFLITSLLLLSRFSHVRLYVTP